MSSSAFAALLCAATAAAPVVVIEHQGATNGPDGPALEARMVSTGGRRIFEPAVFVRPAGGAEFTRLPMSPLGDDFYRASLPAALAGVEIDYFLETFDEEGNGPFRKGGPERPLRLTHADKSPKPVPVELDRSGPRPRRVATIGLVVGGAALVAAGGVCGVLALSDYGAEKSATDTAAWEKARSAARTESVAADALFGVGVAAVAVGAVLWLTDKPSASPSSSPAVSNLSVGAAPMRGGLGALVSGRF